jgi:hypothetical protein
MVRDDDQANSNSGNAVYLAQYLQKLKFAKMFRNMFCWKHAVSQDGFYLVNKILT